MHDLYNLRHIVECIPYYPKPNSKSTPRKGGEPVKRLLLMELMEVIRVEDHHLNSLCVRDSPVLQGCMDLSLLRGMRPMHCLLIRLASMVKQA